MIKKREDLTVKVDKNSNGEKVLSLASLKEFDGVNENLKQFSLVELEPGIEVGYHVHNGDSDMYYIISGKGLYNDNGVEIEVSSGDITFTPTGEGHALKNIGEEKLCFIALVIDD